MTSQRRRARPAVAVPGASSPPLAHEADIEGPSALLDRLIFLSDGVFAIAMTLLVFGLTIPDVSSGDSLAQSLIDLWPKYVSYALSFAVIASYWSAHQRMFRYLVRADNVLVALNVLLLMWIGFQPFSTNVVRTYSGGVAVSFYAGTLAATGAVSLAMWLYASHSHRLIRRSLDARTIHYVTWRAVIVPLVFLVSMPIAQINPTVAQFFWIAILPLMLLLRRAYGGAKTTRV